MYHCTADIEISQQLVYMLFCRRFWPSLAEKIVLLYFTPSFSHLSDHKDFSPQKFSVEQFVWKFGPPKEVPASQKTCLTFSRIRIAPSHSEMCVGSIYHTSQENLSELNNWRFGMFLHLIES